MTIKTRVLVANPCSASLSRIRCIFSPRGYEVTTVERAVDGYRELCRMPPHLLIVDETLRWGGAEGLLAVLTEDSRFENVRVIVTRDGCPLHDEPVLPHVRRGDSRRSPFGIGLPWESSTAFDVFA